MSEKIKIASWNIDKKRNKKENFRSIINDLSRNNDIIVLNEVCYKHKLESIDKIADEYKDSFFYVVNEINDYYIIMFISKKRFDDYKTVVVNNVFGMSILAVEVVLKRDMNEPVKTVKILGVRLNTSLYGNEFKTQLKDFINLLIDKKPDIIIGDFNWKTTVGISLEKVLGIVNERKNNREFSSKICEEILNGKELPEINQDDESEEQFCELINCLCEGNRYQILPFEYKGEEIYSVCALIRHNKYYSKPDRVMWNMNNVLCDSVVYSPSLKIGDKLPEGWPSDHSIIESIFSFVER